ncbi:hypothetical protein F1645_16400 (plasmid) [Novacetimonas hansenii]|uniref:Bacteriophage lambda head decoration protein D n=1 Tax=Novacetimonas hansenii TaxID=436 RepID=A0ABQ0SGD5_NOVHA|nr:hypothetical protein [Novacetimonas hansenii]GAN83792.1 hypothetical protein Gaha_0105_027 [Novacetimonas hansenii JCM 7643]GEC64197.1 hypothetical protein GHA01_20460 [Novacetimonas hansenii]
MVHLSEKMRREHGRVDLKIWRAGVLIAHETDSNLIVEGAANMKAALLSGDTTGKYAIAQIGFGTNAAAAQETDSALTGAYVKPVDGITPNSATGQLTVAFSLAATEANGISISEYGLLSANGVLFARRVRDLPLLKASDLSFSGTWQITF